MGDKCKYMAGGGLIIPAWRRIAYLIIDNLDSLYKDFMVMQLETSKDLEEKNKKN